MTETREFIENKVKMLEAKVDNMGNGIYARKNLRKQLGAKLKLAKESRYALIKAGKSTSIVDLMVNILKEKYNENDAILKHLQDFRKDEHEELWMNKKVLEQLK